MDEQEEHPTTILDVWKGEAQSPEQAAEMADNDWCERWPSYDMLDPEYAHEPASREGYSVYRVVFLA